MKRLAVLGVFLLLLAFGAVRHLDASWTSILPAFAAGTAPQPGTFPATWIDGTNCQTEPKFQVHAYNQDLYIIRQSKCESCEAPFLFLIFGEQEALLMDTGANPNSQVWPVVRDTIRQWLIQKGKASIPLTVAHTHGHGDHISGDSQFVGKPGVKQVVGLSQQAVEQFWGFTNYPVDVPTIDLGNRVLDVLGTPGHQPQSVTLYDRKTNLLLTGDIVYPGHLFVFSAADWPVFVASIERLVSWAATHPVEWVVGCHIEFTANPGRPYKWCYPVVPNEHPLELPPSVLRRVLAAARGMTGNPVCQAFEDFVIHPVYKCGINWNP